MCHSAINHFNMVMYICDSALSFCKTTALSFSVPLKAEQLDLTIYPMLKSHLKNYVNIKQHFSSYITILKINNATILKKYKTAI